MSLHAIQQCDLSSRLKPRCTGSILYYSSMGTEHHSIILAHHWEQPLATLLAIGLALVRHFRDKVISSSKMLNMTVVRRRMVGHFRTWAAFRGQPSAVSITVTALPDAPPTSQQPMPLVRPCTL